MSLKQVVSSANFVYLQPDSKALEYFSDLGFASIPVAKGKPLSHNDRVQKMVNQLISNEVNAILLGRVLFDYNNPADIVAYDLNYGTAYIQPGIVTFPTPLQKSNNFVKCVWFECSSPNSEVQVPLKSTCSSSILLHRMFHFMVGMNATLIPYISSPNNSSRMG